MAGKSPRFFSGKGRYKFIQVTLSTEDMVTAWSVGMARWSESVRKGRKDRLGDKEWLAGLQIHCLGAMGEIGFAKFLNVYPSLRINQFSGGKPDLDPDWEVRYRSNADYDLIVRDRDDDDRRYALIRGQPPVLEVCGWMWGKDAKRAEFRKNYKGLGGAYFVPTEHLNKEF